MTLIIKSKSIAEVFTMTLFMHTIYYDISEKILAHKRHVPTMNCWPRQLTYFHMTFLFQNIYCFWIILSLRAANLLQQ